MARIRNRNLLMLVGVLATFTVVGACYPSTTLEQGWTTPTAQSQPPLKKVVTVFISDSITLRRAAEDKLARDLASHGMAATPGYALLTDEEARTFDKAIDQKAGDNPMKVKLRNLGYDGVVTMRIVDREQDVVYTPSTYYGGWGYPGYWGYWGYPGYSWPDWAYTETIYRSEAKAYSLKTNQLVWSGLVRSVDPSAGSLISETSHIVSGQLVKQGLAG